MKPELILVIIMFALLIVGILAIWFILITRKGRVEKNKRNNKPIRIELIDILAYLPHETSLTEGRKIIVRSLEDSKLYIIEPNIETHCRVQSRMDYKEMVSGKITLNGNPKVWLAMKDGVQTKEELKNKIDFHEQGNMWITKNHKSKLDLNNIYQIDGAGKYPYVATNQSFSYYKFNKEIPMSLLKDAIVVSAIVEFDIEEKYKKEVM